MFVHSLLISYTNSTIKGKTNISYGLTVSIESSIAGDCARARCKETFFSRIQRERRVDATMERQQWPEWSDRLVLSLEPYLPNLHYKDDPSEEGTSISISMRVHFENISNTGRFSRTRIPLLTVFTFHSSNDNFAGVFGKCVVA